MFYYLLLYNLYYTLCNVLLYVHACHVESRRVPVVVKMPHDVSPVNKGFLHVVSRILSLRYNKLPRTVCSISTKYMHKDV